MSTAPRTRRSRGRKPEDEACPECGGWLCPTCHEGHIDAEAARCIRQAATPTVEQSGPLDAGMLAEAFLQWAGPTSGRVRVSFNLANRHRVAAAIARHYARLVPPPAQPAEGRWCVICPPQHHWIPAQPADTALREALFDILDWTKPVSLYMDGSNRFSTKGTESVARIHNRALTAFGEEPVRVHQPTSSEQDRP